MIASTLVTRSTPTTLIWLAALSLFLGAAPGRAAEPPAPTPLAPTASASPEIQAPAGEPQRLLLQAPAAGTAGPAVARAEGKVAAGRPVSYALRPETTGLFSIGVSSPQNAARISIYLGDSTEPAQGTTVADGAIRWSTELIGGTAVKIVVHTAGAEIPFRVEVIGGPGSL